MNAYPVRGLTEAAMVRSVADSGAEYSAFSGEHGRPARRGARGAAQFGSSSRAKRIGTP